MKIAICGKGGSGKSTLSALLAGQALREGYRVLVVDSDESNSGLHRMLGLSEPPRPLMELVGGKKALKGRLGEPSILEVDTITLDALQPPYAVSHNGLTMVSIGKIMQGLEGCACPMGVLGREFLRKLKLTGKEVALVDMEAGVEHFGRGIDSEVTKIVAVVEPSWESVELTGRIQKLSQDIGVKPFALLNKLPSAEIAARLEAEVEKRGIMVIGELYLDPQIAAYSLEGRELWSIRIPEGLKGALEYLLST